MTTFLLGIFGGVILCFGTVTYMIAEHPDGFQKYVDFMRSLYEEDSEEVES